MSFRGAFSLSQPSWKLGLVSVLPSQSLLVCHETRSLEEQMDAEDELLGIDPAAEPQSDSASVSIKTSAASGLSVDDSQPSDPSPENIEPAEETGDLPVDELQSSRMFGSRDYRYQPGSQQCPGSSPEKNSEPPGLQE